MSEVPESMTALYFSAPLICFVPYLIAVKFKFQYPFSTTLWN
jgi:hypothetical protein